MNLESTAEALLEWSPNESIDLARRERRLERFGEFAFSGFGLVVLIGVFGLIYTILTKMILTGTQPLVGILLIVFLVFAVLALAYIVFKEDLKEKRKKARSTPAIELKGAAITGKLLEERDFEPIPTVTENTTDLLPVSERKS